MATIVPAIDIIDGKCVRLSQGSYSSKKSYSDSPYEVAQRFEDAGLKRLHVVDLDGARAGRVVSYNILERIASRTSLAIDFGGGIRTEKDLSIAFECGAKMACLGSVSVKDRKSTKEWLSRYGTDAIVFCADVLEKKIKISGWEEETELWLFDYMEEWMAEGASLFLCTDIEKDGMLAGPSTDLYEEIRDRLPQAKLIASGGVSSMKDIEKLAAIGAHEIIVGKALYEGLVQLSDLASF